MLGGSKGVAARPSTGASELLGLLGSGVCSSPAWAVEFVQAPTRRGDFVRDAMSTALGVFLLGLQGS